LLACPLFAIAISKKDPMPSRYDIIRHQKLLAMYRDLLTEYLRQTGMWDNTETPAFLRTGISVIRGHILDLKGTLRGWKVQVADQSIDQGSEDDIADEVASQRELLHIHRRNLSIYLKQQEQYGEGQAPPVVLHSLNWNREQIQRIKAILRGLGVAVDDLPEEELS
jgi:hypothetical protein